jgi:hypothetical protein
MHLLTGLWCVPGIPVVCRDVLEGNVRRAIRRHPLIMDMPRGMKDIPKSRSLGFVAVILQSFQVKS